MIPVMESDNEFTSMSVSLTRSQKEYVREQSARAGCSTPSEYVCRLIHQDQKRRAREGLEQLLLEGLSSGPDAVMTAEDWADIRREVATRVERRRRSR